MGLLAVACAQVRGQDHSSGSRGLKALHRGQRREAEGEGQGSNSLRAGPVRELGTSKGRRAKLLRIQS